MEALIALSKKAISFSRNEFLQVGGNIDTNLYFVKSGAFKIFIETETGEQIIRFGYKDNFVALLDSFLTNNPTIYFIQALKKSSVEVISKESLNNFLQVNANKNVWQSLLENLILQQLDREIDLLTTSPKQRYERVLARSPQLFQEISNRHIANYLRMSPETLSRLKSVDIHQQK